MPGESGIFLVKTDDDGVLLWENLIGGTNDRGMSIDTTGDGGYIVLGLRSIYLSPFTDDDAWLIKIDADGKKLWDKFIGRYSSETGRCIQETGDGSFIFVGAIWPEPTQTDIWLVRASSSDLTEIHLKYPTDGTYGYGEFFWSYNGGTVNAFAVEFSLSPSFVSYWSTYENLGEIIFDSHWVAPQPLWDRIPPGSSIYWRVRGMDSEHQPPSVITSSEVWLFQK
jgi:hypothetical protein